MDIESILLLQTAELAKLQNQLTVTLNLRVNLVVLLFSSNLKKLQKSNERYSWFKRWFKNMFSIETTYTVAVSKACLIFTKSVIVSHILGEAITTIQYGGKQFVKTVN